MSSSDISGKSARNWDAIAAVIAALIGLLALCVSAYTASIQRQQAKAQVWTELFIALTDTDRAMIVINKGVGPARIKSFRQYVDGKAQTDWDHVIAALGAKPKNGLIQSTINNTVVAAGERVEYLKLNDADDWQQFRAQMSRAQKYRLRARICYCSVLDECRVIDQTAQSREDADVVVPKCERVESEEFTE